ncbi:MAG TPA: flagellar protein FlaG [Nitrospiraceae bacterium]|nr:flagellar protein FlaG [Nitrospiraceae bacterium]
MVHEVTSRTELLAPASEVNASVPHRNLEREQPEQESAVHQTRRVEASDLEEAVARVRDVFQQVEPRLQFEIDPDLHRVIVKIMNGESGEVIRQIPPKEVLDLAKNFQASTGLLLKQEA